MRERFKEILETICADPATEARWLNTLSLLEYIGARKIGKTMCQEHPSAVVLDHWADETRHAYAFKRLCEEVAGGPCEEYLAKDAALTYFQTLDERASQWARETIGEDDPRLNYLLVTTLVERRAMMGYPLYRAASDQPVVRKEVQAIIVEEQDHRVELEERCLAMLDAHGAEPQEAFDLEAELFDGFLDALAGELAA
ncbi:MAG: hypothetical protein ACOCV2_09465 [Persicimonas sp.]